MMIKTDQTKLENFTCFNSFLAFSEIMFNKINDESEVSDIGPWFILLLLFKIFICTLK